MSEFTDYMIDGPESNQRKRKGPRGWQTVHFVNDEKPPHSEPDSPATATWARVKGTEVRVQYLADEPEKFGAGPGYRERAGCDCKAFFRFMHRVFGQYPPLVACRRMFEMD